MSALMTTMVRQLSQILSGRLFHQDKNKLEEEGKNKNYQRIAEWNMHLTCAVSLLVAICLVFLSLLVIILKSFPANNVLFGLTI
jgi:hypothetical protein